MCLENVNKSPTRRGGKKSQNTRVGLGFREAASSGDLGENPIRVFLEVDRGRQTLPKTVGEGWDLTLGGSVGGVRGPVAPGLVERPARHSWCQTLPRTEGARSSPHLCGLENVLLYLSSTTETMVRGTGLRR